MPTVYSTTLGENSEQYYRTKAEALAHARQVTGAEDGEEWGDVEVNMHRIEKINLDRFLAALNQRGWSDSSEVVAVLRKGRIVAKRSE